jgi:hypothetical protein
MTWLLKLVFITLLSNICGNAEPVPQVRCAIPEAKGWCPCGPGVVYCEGINQDVCIPMKVILNSNRK